MNQSLQNIISKSSIEETEARVWELLNTVADPEIPVLSVMDLGIVRDIKVENQSLEVIITLTYNGCPAMDLIGMNIREKLMENNFDKIRITHRLSPAWTTDWMQMKEKKN